MTAPRGGDEHDHAERLLAAIAADPADDQARSVYADLLLERGDPRGRFIAIQLARVGRALTDAEETMELELLGLHGQTWLGALAGFVFGDIRDTHLGVEHFDGRTRFERGFVTSCTLDAGSPDLLRLARDPIFATVEHLGLRRADDVSRAAFATFLQTATLGAVSSLQVPHLFLDAVLADPIATRLRGLRVVHSTPKALERVIEARLSELRTLWFGLDLPIGDGFRDQVTLDEAVLSTIQRALAQPLLRLELEMPQLRASYQRTAGWRVWISNPDCEAAYQLKRLAGN